MSYFAEDGENEEEAESENKNDSANTSQNSIQQSQNSSNIDNPYLQAAKIPKTKE